MTNPPRFIEHSAQTALALSIQVTRLRRLHGLSEANARLIAGLHYGEVMQ